MEDSLRTATVIARVETVLWQLDREGFENVAKKIAKDAELELKEAAKAAKAAALPAAAAAADDDRIPDLNDKREQEAWSSSGSSDDDDGQAAMALATMDETRFPVPIGVFRRHEKANYEQAVNLQVEHAKNTTQQSLKDLIYAGEIWDVK